MSIDSLINPQGTLVDIAKQVDLKTVQHAWEIQCDRRTNEDLRNMLFWTADFPLYTVEKGKAVLYMAQREHNLIFQNLDTAVQQLGAENNYFPKDSDIGAVIDDKSTLRVNLSGLKLKRENDEWSYFEIDTKRYSRLNREQKALAERVHGKGKEFVCTMKTLSERIQKTGIYVLNPDYVKSILGQKKAKSLARASALNDFYGNSDFNADNRIVDNNCGRLRGVRRVPAKRDAPKVPQETKAVVDEFDGFIRYKGRAYIPLPPVLEK